MKRYLLTITCILFTLSAYADGVPLENGRYAGPVLVVTLTPEQKQVIDHFRTCHLENFKTMNAYTPYIFTLTPQQTTALIDKKGFSPKVFEVYETYRGFNDAGPHWNLALRFSDDEIEIPLDLVVTNEQARKEHEMQGWKTSNPCFPFIGKQGTQKGAPMDAQKATRP